MACNHGGKRENDQTSLTLDWLRDGARAERTRERLGQLHERLRRDTARLATDTIARLCDARPS